MTDVVLLKNPILQYRVNSSVPVNIEAAARRIANLLGGELRDEGKSGDTAYYVPFAAVHSDLAATKSITGRGDVYGGIVREYQHADKAILHSLPRPEGHHPAWYSSDFAEAVSRVVLPGYTAFTYEDTLHGFSLMREGGFSVRLKDPASTGGLGQHLVHDEGGLSRVLAGYEAKLPKSGIVLEADLHGPATITIGYVNIAGSVYTWHGRPYDVNHDGMMRFGGNELTVVRGDLETLHQYSVDPGDRLAIEQAKCVFDAYDLLGTVISRATLDVVQGTACDGKFLSGVTDPSLRPSASSAAEIRAIEALTADGGATVAKTRLQYDYEKKIKKNPAQELFVGHSRMNIFVELTEVG